MIKKFAENRWLIVLLLGAWVGYYLAALLDTGFISDDAYNSQIRGVLIQDGRTVFQRTYDEIAGWVTGAGRFFPLGWYIYTLYYFTQDPFVVKLITLAVIAADVVMFAIFVKKETNSLRIALLAGLLVPIFFQFRLWHDPFLAFTFLMPIVFAYTMAALVLFQKYLAEEKEIYLYWSALAYLLALLTYEISYPLSVLFLVLAFSRFGKLKPSVKKSLPFLLLSLVFFGLMVVLRLYFLSDNASTPQSTYPGAQLHGNLLQAFQAFKVQTFATLPLSYYFFKTDGLKLLFHRADVLFLVAYFVLNYLLMLGVAKKEKLSAGLGGLVVSGVLLLALPALVISLSGHQKELIQMGYGFGYIPVYFQYFGLCLIALVALLHIFANLSARSLVVVVLLASGVLTGVAAINLGLNRAVASETNKFFKYPRRLLESALKAGVVDELKDGATLLRTMRFPSDYTWFYSTVTGKKFNICSIDEITAYKKCIDDLSSAPQRGSVGAASVAMGTVEVVDTRNMDVWILSYNFDKELGERGQLVLGKVDHIVQNVASKAPIQIVVKDLVIYQLEERRVQRLNLDAAPVNFLKLVENEGAAPSALKNFDPLKLRAEEVEFQWLGDVLAREGTDRSNLRWSSGAGKLVLYNFTDKVQVVKIAMRLGAAAEGNSHMTIQYPSHVEKFGLDQRQIDYAQNLSLPPGETMINFVSDGKPIANGDPRKIVFGIFDFQLLRVQ